MGRNAAARAQRFAWPIIARQVENVILETLDA
jgi:hypothetical protein